MSGGAGTIAGNLKLAVHQSLANYDDRGGLHPMLAESLPSRDDGSWVVRSDGTMTTTYRLRPGVTWHDGTPLTSADFVFGWQVTKDPDVPMRNRNIARRITGIDVPDDRTLVIEWDTTYPFANALVDDQIGPMPRHLLEQQYTENKEHFADLPYWTRQFVGVGPYRLQDWEAGSHLTLRAYDQFYAGRPKIDALVFQFIPDPQTTVANLLAGSIDGAIPRALDFSDVSSVKSQWEQAGRKPLAIIQPTHWRVFEPQLRRQLANPPEILDVRVRRALLSAIDRQALVDTLLDGTLPVSDTFFFPEDAKWDWVKDVVVKYEFDLRKAVDSLSAVGWVRGPSGSIVDASGKQVSIPVETSAGAQSEQELSIIAANWRDLGFAVDQHVRTAAEARDNRLNSIFPGFSASAGPLTFEHLSTRLHSASCPGDANRWTGPNHGCYQNPEFDRLLDGLQSAIEPNDQRALYRSLVRIQTEDLPVFPLYFNPQAMIFREGVVGIRGDTQPRTAMTWNAGEWDVR
ncbi:MAG TPA: peptide ABC transporter substrate-binding protein [Chloroflexota bacterium]|nr:peptide ABC transporter substrate-binding protein [Chloroflexota bacterium]